MDDYTGGMLCKKHKKELDKKYPNTQSVEARLFHYPKPCEKCGKPSVVWARALMEIPDVN